MTIIRDMALGGYQPEMMTAGELTKAVRLLREELHQKQLKLQDAQEELMPAKAKIISLEKLTDTLEKEVGALKEQVVAGAIDGARLVKVTEQEFLDKTNVPFGSAP